MFCLWAFQDRQGDLDYGLASGTVLVHPDLPLSGMDAGGTVVIHDDPDGGNYLAAVQAAGADSDGYVASLRVGLHII